MYAGGHCIRSLLCKRDRQQGCVYIPLTKRICEWAHIQRKSALWTSAWYVTYKWIAVHGAVSEKAKKGMRWQWNGEDGGKRKNKQGTHDLWLLWSYTHIIWIKSICLSHVDTLLVRCSPHSSVQVESFLAGQVAAIWQFRFWRMRKLVHQTVKHIMGRLLRLQRNRLPCRPTYFGCERSAATTSGAKFKQSNKCNFDEIACFYSNWIELL